MRYTGGVMEVTSAAALGSAVRGARRSANLSQQELADRAGMSRVALARLELGETNATLESVLRLANVLQMRLELTWEPGEVEVRQMPRKRPSQRHTSRDARDHDPQGSELEGKGRRDEGLAPSAKSRSSKGPATERTVSA